MSEPSLFSLPAPVVSGDVQGVISILDSKTAARLVVAADPVAEARPVSDKTAG